MRGVITRIPFRLQKPLAGGLAGAAAIAVAAGLINLTLRSDIEETFFQDAFTAESAADQKRADMLLVSVCLFVGAVLLLVIAGLLATESDRLKKYLPILKGTELISIQEIIDITGSKRSTVYGDLRSLINSNMINDLYIDYKAEHVVSKTYIPGSSSKTVITCDGCGGNNEVIIGITKPCSFCGQPLKLNLTPPPPRPGGHHAPPPPRPYGR